MAVRTTETTVTFKHSFQLTETEDALPPGTYHLIMDDEELPGLDFISYRRVATILLVPGIDAPQERRRTTLYISQTELDAALMRDAGTAI